ncbi:ABC transporter permease [Nocardiopsis sp. TSRI0078]|uniref:carbohydrate ABC transporter permease n=1 Tax=unclassified Nocardiopsis TaxID=2649073 RepID=UPI0009405986|nr:carbohydrate ABC transporter permease [Nocardiopsis sp. TSRI0078]OKI23508.1 ABC transporter permease [Nocardiopsis sp. TSRI0078]
MTATTLPDASRQYRRRRIRPARALLHAFLGATALAWFFPVLWALVNSFRDYDHTALHGYLSLGGFTLDNYANAWNQGELPGYFWNSLVITVPAVLLTLLLSSCAAFVLSNYSRRFNLVMLAVFLAANLLPAQALLVPLFRLYTSIPLPYWISESGSLYDSHLGIVLIHTAFQIGFCTFVLSNFMKAMPASLLEAARVDGASVLQQYWGVVLPLCRPSLAALATLLVTWIYNDFFWALALLSSGDKLPITTALQNLQSAFFVDYNLLSAGSVIVALPTLVVFFLLQRHFVAGLTLGASKE